MSFAPPIEDSIRYRETAPHPVGNPTRGRECPVCLGQHEEEIHTATLRVHRWFRVEVTKGMARRPVC